MNPADGFLAAFRAGDIDAARALIAREPELSSSTDYQVHPLLAAFVDGNDGHCYKAAHLAVADLLIAQAVRSFGIRCEWSISASDHNAPAGARGRPYDPPEICVHPRRTYAHNRSWFAMRAAMVQDFGHAHA